MIVIINQVYKKKMPAYDSGCLRRCVEQAISSQYWCSDCCSHSSFYCSQGTFLTGCNNRRPQCQPCVWGCKSCTTPFTCRQCQDLYCLTGGTISYCVKCPPDCLQWDYYRQCVRWKSPQNQTNFYNDTNTESYPEPPQINEQKNHTGLILGLVAAFAVAVVVILMIILAIYKFKTQEAKQEIQRQRSSSQNLPTQICAICLESLQLGQVIATDCNHQFHRNCLRQWKIRRNNCPLCIRDLNFIV